MQAVTLTTASQMSLIRSGLGTNDRNGVDLSSGGFGGFAPASKAWRTTSHRTPGDEGMAFTTGGGRKQRVSS